MLYLILIEFFLVVSIGWSTVSAQKFTFDQTATGPSVTCRGGIATFTCRIVVIDGRFLQSNQWIFSNGTVINSDHPNHMLRSDPMGLVTDLVVSNVDANTSYTCTTASAPSDFFSTASLTVAEPPIISEITLRGGCGYLNVSWTSGDGMCGTVNYFVSLSSPNVTTTISTTAKSYNFTGLPLDTIFNVTVFASDMAGNGTPSGRTYALRNTFILQKCVVTSPSVGTVRVSCDSAHQIQVTVTCTSCTQPMTITKNGSSPVVVRGLRPGAMYSVTINVVDGSQVILPGQNVTEEITAMSEDDGGSSGSNIGAIAGGVVGGVAGAVSSGIIFFMLYWFCCRGKETDGGDEEKLKSPAFTNVSYVGVISSARNDQSAIVPHQKTANGEEYAVSTKTTGKPQEQQKQQPLKEYAQVDKSKKKQPQQAPVVPYAALEEEDSQQTAQQQIPASYDYLGEDSTTADKKIQYAAPPDLPTNLRRLTDQDPPTIYTKVTENKTWM